MFFPATVRKSKIAVWSQRITASTDGNNNIKYPSKVRYCSYMTCTTSNVFLICRLWNLSLKSTKQVKQTKPI